MTASPSLLIMAIATAIYTSSEAARTPRQLSAANSLSKDNIKADLTNEQVTSQYMDLIRGNKLIHNTR